LLIQKQAHKVTSFLQEKKRTQECLQQIPQHQRTKNVNICLDVMWDMIMRTGSGKRRTMVDFELAHNEISCERWDGAY